MGLQVRTTAAMLSLSHLAEKPVAYEPVTGLGIGLSVADCCSCQSCASHSHADHAYEVVRSEILFAPVAEGDPPRAAQLLLVTPPVQPIPPVLPLPEPEPEPDPEPESEPEPEPEPVEPDPLPVVEDGFDDMLFGGEGNDLLVGGPGRDYLSGGPGADRFWFADGDFAGGTADLADVIADFSEAEGDIIDLSAIDAIAGGGNDAFRFIGGASFSGMGGELRTVRHEDFLLLEGDISGNGIADIAIRLDGLASISVSAIIL